HARGMWLNLRGGWHPFVRSSLYRSIAALPFHERLRALRVATVRERIVAEPCSATWDYANTYRIASNRQADWKADDCIALIAKQQGRPPAEVAYDMLTAEDG